MEAYEPLARKLARKFARSHRDEEDCCQVARLAMLRALDRYDPSRGVKFTTFAWATVTGELKRYCRDNGWSMHFPRALKELYLEVAATSEELPSVLGHEPTALEVATWLGKPESDVRECLDIRSRKPLSLDLLLVDAPDAPGPSGASAAMRTVEDRSALEWGLSRLRSPDREIVVLHYLQGLSQDEIARRLGANQMRVSRALTRGLDHLRALLGPPVTPSAA
jgi:RNA polymerase sigma-B factor